jgi:hypothetical protein
VVRYVLMYVLMYPLRFRISIQIINGIFHIHLPIYDQYHLLLLPQISTQTWNYFFLLLKSPAIRTSLKFPISDITSFIFPRNSHLTKTFISSLTA